MNIKITAKSAQGALLCQIKTNLFHVEEMLRHGAPKAAASLMAEIAEAAGEYYRLSTEPVHEQSLIELLVPSPKQAEMLNFPTEAIHPASELVQAVIR